MLKTLPVLAFLALPSTGFAKLVRSVESGVPDEPPAQHPVREITALPANGVVTIDGVFDEPCWRPGLWIGDWLLNDGSGRRPEAETRFKVRFDAESIYIAVRADEPNIAHLRETDGASHDRQAYTDDCVEVWLDPDNLRRRAYHLVFSVAGGTWDGIQAEEFRADPKASAAGATRPLRIEDKKWDATAEAAFVKADDHWTCELRLPVTDYGLDELASGSTWGLNIARERWALPGGGRGEYSSLTGVFSWPMSAFADLSLGLPPVEVTNLDLGALGVGENELRFNWRSPRRELDAVDVRVSIHDREWRSDRDTMKLDPTEPVVWRYPIAESEEVSVTLDLLRPGSEEILYRRTATRRLAPIVCVAPSSNIRHVGRGPWWADVSLRVGDVSLAAAELRVELVSAAGRIVRRQSLRELHARMRLHFDLRSVRAEGEYALRFTVIHDGEPLGEAHVPLRLIAPPI